MDIVALLMQGISFTEHIKDEGLFEFVIVGLLIYAMSQHKRDMASITKALDVHIVDADKRFDTIKGEIKEVRVCDKCGVLAISIEDLKSSIEEITSILIRHQVKTLPVKQKWIDTVSSNIYQNSRIVMDTINSCITPIADSGLCVTVENLEYGLDELAKKITEKRKKDHTSYVKLGMGDDMLEICQTINDILYPKIVETIRSYVDGVNSEVTIESKLTCIKWQTKTMVEKMHTDWMEEFNRRCNAA